MYLLPIALLVSSLSHANCYYYPKCCKAQDSLREVNSTLRCIENKLRRMYVVTNESDFLNDHPDGQCVDVSTDFFVFNVTDGEIVGKRPVNADIFPKCCPMNYTYNSVIHACEKSDTDIDFVKEKFIKVGLPKCKIIVDQDLKEIKNLRDPLKNINSQSYCIDKNEKGLFVYRECKENIDVCQNIKCIKKCCPDGKSFVNGRNCLDTYIHGLNLSTFRSVEKPAEPFAIISNRECPSVYIMREGKYNFTLNNKGALDIWINRLGTFNRYDVNNLNSYCVEHLKTSTLDEYIFVMCSQNPLAEKFEYTKWAKILSCICLVLTVLVYVALHETRNTFGKLLVNYCVAIFIENAWLTYSQMSLHPSYIDCLVRGFNIIYFVSASFTWSNVICCEIYRTIGSMKQRTGSPRNNYKKLLLYHAYGWGVPTIITSFIVIFHYWRVLPDSIQPYLANKNCFLERREGNYALFLFLNFPHLLIQLVNTVFFIKTTVYCLRVKNEISKIKDSTSNERYKRFQKDKERLFLILKLSVIMGLSFSFEVVSSFLVMREMGTTAKYIEVVWDNINCLQGVFIFVIFICKRKLYNELLRKFKISYVRDVSTSSFSTQTTSSKVSKRASYTESE